MRAKRRGEPWSAMETSEDVSARNRPSDAGHCGGLRRKIRAAMEVCLQRHREIEGAHTDLFPAEAGPTESLSFDR